MNDETGTGLMPGAEPRPEQAEMPFAMVQGSPVLALPRDLYIPPDALEVFLDAFEGPLDLLLYLIKRQNLDILDIPIAEITRQYMGYIELMKELQLGLAAEYLVMASMLAEIKSRMLLPRPVSDEEDEEDPRAELIRRLQEYERYKQAAEDVNALDRIDRDVFQAGAEAPALQVVRLAPDVNLQELLIAFREMLQRAEMYAHHHIQREPLSVRQRMSEVLGSLGPERYTEFTALFKAEEGRMGVVVTFIAILELIRESLVQIVQDAPYAPIHVKAAASVAEEPEIEPTSVKE